MKENDAKNPCGLDGFAFLEFSGPDKRMLDTQFIEMGFHHSTSHKTENITLYQQGKIKFIVNAASNCQAQEHATNHGAGVCAMGFRVKNVEQAYNYAVKQGAKPFQDCKQADHGLPAVQAIGGSVIYFVDDEHQPFGKQWQINPAATHHEKDCGLTNIDHLTHNVFRGNMDKWAHFYESIFNFREIRFFNIVGQMTGLVSRALARPCDKIKIPYPIWIAAKVWL